MYAHIHIHPAIKDVQHTIYKRIINSIISLLVNSTYLIDAHRMLLLMWAEFWCWKPTYIIITSVVLT